MANEANDAPFTVHVIGDTTERTYTGEFRAKKRLSHRDHLRKDQVRRELLGGQAGLATERAITTSMILSELAVRLTKWESWWDVCGKGLDLEDDNVIGVLYDKVIAIENEAVEGKKKAAEKIADEVQAEVKKEAAEQAK